MKKVKIAFIGVGNMASAIIGGVAEDGISHSDVILFDRHPVKTAPFKTQRYTVASSAVDAAEQADIIVLATQPQSFPELLSELGTAQLDGKCFVSIAAGIKTETAAHRQECYRSDEKQLGQRGRLQAHLSNLFSHGRDNHSARGQDERDHQRHRQLSRVCLSVYKVDNRCSPRAGHRG